MYRITYGDNVIFDPYDEELKVTDASMSDEINAAAYLDFTISVLHPLYDTIQEHDKVVCLYFNGSTLFQGIVYSIESDIQGNKIISCVSAMDYLNDTVVRPYSTVASEADLLAPTSIDGYFQWLIDQHNDHVMDLGKRFEIGINQGGSLSKSNYIAPSSTSYSTTASEISSNIIDPYGGYLTLRYDGNRKILDLYSDVHEMNAQIIDFGVNIVDITKTIDTESQYTALIPQGGSPAIEDGGFESNSYSEWVVHPDTKLVGGQVHQGSHASYFTSGNGEYVNKVVFYAKNGRRYKGTIWVKNERSSDVVVHFGYQINADGDWDNVDVQNGSLSVPNDGEWHEFSVDFMLNASEYDKIRPRWYFDSVSNDNGKRVYVDDLDFRQIDGDSDIEEDPIDLKLVADGIAPRNSGIAIEGDALYSIDAVREYGYREKVWRDDAITDVDDLLEAAVVQLNKLRNPVLSITVKAIDLSLYMDNYDHLQVGQAVRVRSKLHDLDEYFMVSSITLDLQDPKQTEYTLGVSYDTFTGQQSSYIRSLNSGINSSLDSVASLDQSVKDQAVQIGSVEQIANDAKDTADNAQNTANSAQQAAQDAQNSASSALDKAEAVEGAVSEIQEMIDDINSGAEQAKQDAAQAKADAQQAAAKADAASQTAQAAANKADALEGSITDVTTTVNGVVQDIEEITTSVTGAISTANEALSAASSASQDLEGFKTTVSQTYQLKGDYATNTDLDEAIAEEVLNRNSAIEQSASSITSTVSQTYATKTDLAVTDGKAAQAQSAAQQAQTSASNAQSTANGVAEDLTDYMETVATTYASKSELEQTSESITATVEANYTEVKQLANTAQSTADSALSKANEASGELADFTESVTSDLSDLQSQIDGNIATWFYAGTPTLTNEPAVNWTTTEEKNQHLGDLYYDTNNGYAWRFMVQNGSYSWGRITDSDVTKALEDAANARDTADSKRRVFVSQPTPPYDVGDLWVQGENGDILRCATARASGSYNASDWVLASKYTDDSALEIFEGQVADIYSTKAELETATDAITATVEENFEKSVLVKEADGGIIDCGDTAGMPLAGLTVYGQTRQNLWANPSYETGTVNGITYTINSNGTMTFSGTATASRTIYSGRKYILKPGTQYTVQVDRKLADTYVPGNADGACFFITNYTSEGAYIKDVAFGYGTLLRTTFTTPSNLGYCTFNINISQGVTVSGTYRVMLNEGSEPEPWCPPGLNSVEGLSLMTAGKNLLARMGSSLPYTIAGITFSDNGDGGIRVIGTATATAYYNFFSNRPAKALRITPGEYTASLIGGGSGLNLSVGYFNGEIGADFTGSWIATNIAGVPRTNSIDRPVYIRAFISVASGLTVNTVVYPQLELGSTATEYEPPNVNTVPIPLLGNKVSSLPDGTRDELVVDAGGNVVLRKKTHQQVIVGDDLLDQYTSNTDWITLCKNPILDYEHPYDGSLSIEDNAAFSDKIPYYPVGNTGALPVFSNSRIGISTTSQNAPQAVYVNTPLNTTVAKAREWLNDNPVQFLYALKDPYDIPLGTVDLPDLPEQNAHVWISTGTQGLDPDIHATWYGENASALKDFASKAELKVESDQIKATVEETYSTKEEVSAVEDKADAAQDALDSYKSTVSTTYATKSEVTQTANSIKSEVSETYTTKTEFNGLEIGGRNLLLESDTPNRHASPTDYPCAKYSLSQKVVSGETYTATISGTFTDAARWAVYFGGGSYGTLWKPVGGDGSKTLSMTFTATSSMAQQTYVCIYVRDSRDTPAFNGTAVIKWAKLEKGTKATDWSPAPEDMLSTADASATYATKQSVTTVEQTVDGLKSTVSSNYTTLNDKFGSYYTKTEVDQKDNSIKSTVSSVQTTANNALEKATEVEQTADGLSVRVTQAEKDVDTAQSTANTAKTNAATAQSTANTANSTANAAKTAAANAQSKADSAYSKATTLEVTVDGIEGRVADAEGNISTLEQTSSGLEVRLTQAEKDVDTAQSTASSAQNTANTAESTASTASTNATNALNRVTVKATRNDTQNPQCDVTNYPKQQVQEFKNCSAIGLSGVGTFCYLTTYVPWVDNSGGYPKQTAKVDSTGKEYWRSGTSNTAWSAWVDAYGTATNAAKTATNYLKFDSSGLCVGNMTASTLSYNTLITSTGLHIRNGTEDLASFEVGTIDLGGIPIEDAGTQGVLNSKINFAGGSLDSKTYVTSGGRMETQLRLYESRGLSDLLLTADTATLSGPSVTLRAETGQIILSPVIGGVYKKSTSYEMFAARRLYYNSSGTTGNVTLSESAANFYFIDIFFSNWDGYRDCVRVYAPNGNSAVLSNAVYKNEGTATYVRNKVVTISGTSVSVVSNRNGEAEVRQNNSCSAIDSTGVIKIYAVWGWK